jgi:hypothetical protein
LIQLPFIEAFRFVVGEVFDVQSNGLRNEN